MSDKGFCLFFFFAFLSKIRLTYIDNTEHTSQVAVNIFIWPHIQYLKSYIELFTN